MKLLRSNYIVFLFFQTGTRELHGMVNLAFCQGGKGKDIRDLGEARGWDDEKGEDTGDTQGSKIREERIEEASRQLTLH